MTASPLVALAGAGRWTVCLAAMLLLAPGGRGQAAGTVPWVVPPAVQALDFRAQTPNRKIVFLDNGMAIEMPLAFAMLGRDKVSVVASLPEPGRFEVELTSPKAMVEVKNLGVKDGYGKTEIAAKIPVMDWNGIQRAAEKDILQLLEPLRPAAQQELKSRKPPELRKFLETRKRPVPKEDKKLLPACVDALTIERCIPLVRPKLEELAAKRASWIASEQMGAWSRQKDRGMALAYQRLLAFEKAMDHLNQWDIEFDSQSRNIGKLLEVKVAGIHALASGVSGDRSAKGFVEASQAVNLITNDDRNRVSEGLKVTLSCRFYPATDPNDPNSQWYNGQRVTCVARHASLVRVEGRLDPAKQDCVDWWQLNGFSPTSVSIKSTEDSAVRVEPPFVDARGARLRVLATGDKPADYWFEFQPRRQTKGDRTIVIRESPSWPNAKFPF